MRYKLEIVGKAPLGQKSGLSLSKALLTRR